MSGSEETLARLNRIREWLLNDVTHGPSSFIYVGKESYNAAMDELNAAIASHEEKLKTEVRE